MDNSEPEAHTGEEHGPSKDNGGAAALLVPEAGALVLSTSLGTSLD